MKYSSAETHLVYIVSNLVLDVRSFIGFTCSFLNLQQDNNVNLKWEDPVPKTINLHFNHLCSLL